MEFPTTSGGSAVLLATSSVQDFAGPGMASLLPPALAFITILLVRRAWIALAVGGLSAALLTVGGPFAGLKFYLEAGIFGALEGSWHVGAILFTFLLGAFSGVLESSGGLRSLFSRFLPEGRTNSPRRFSLVACGFGFLCFFDGLANSLLVGRVLSPAADRAGVSRVKLAYIADSTGSALACIAFISTWIAAQLSYIEGAVAAVGLQEAAPSGYELFFASIPYNFYCIFTLLLVVLASWWNWNPGAMARFEAAAREKRSAAAPVQPEAESPTGAWRALVPLGTLTLSIPLFFYIWDTSPLFPVTTDKVQEAFGGRAGPYALTAGAATALAVAALCFPFRRKGGPGVGEAAMRGAAGFLHPILVLILAWAFGAMLKDLGTAQTLANLLSGLVGPAGFPALVFLVGAATSFITGSSWGTMGLLMPIAVPGLFALPEASVDTALALQALPATIAAVFGGAVFGDHCSPFSDTTIVSSIATGVEPRDHIQTQLPYALWAALISLVCGYGAFALGLPAIVGIGAGAGLLLVLVLRGAGIDGCPKPPEG